MLELLIFLLMFVFFVALYSIKIVRQAEVIIIERLGKFNKVAGSGLNIIIPFLDRVVRKVSLKQQLMDIPPQTVITKDNVTITIDTFVYFQVTDPFKSVYEIEDLIRGISYLAVTTMRDIVGKMELDNTFASRDDINTQLRLIMDEATDKWGVRIERVEVKDIRPPADIKDAMEKQMNAERTKRALILQAEGQKQAAITTAEGEKQAQILNAEAERQSKITRAQGEREARILHAEGEARGIEVLAKAEAQKVKLVFDAIKAAEPDEKLVAIKTLEALQAMANGPANKIFIPFDATKALGTIGAIKEMLKD